jgi:stage II sporulation protein P
MRIARTSVKEPAAQLPSKPDHEQRKIAGTLVKAALLTATALCLALSAVFVSRLGQQGQSVAAIGGGLSDPALVDASGEDAIFEQSIIDPRLILAQELPVIYGVDIEEVSLEDDTNQQQSPETDIYFDVLPEDIKMEILGFANDTPKEFHVGASGPQILIYHTHTKEAYRQTTTDEYVEAGAWRTEDETHSVIAVGDVLDQELERYGYKVLHNTTDHEPPSLKTAYDRSLVTMEDYQKQYPTIKVYIDLHRDAYNDVEAGKKDFVTVNGEECARVMCVVGTGEKYSVKPNYESNYKLALAFTNEMEKIKKGFTRPIRVKTGRYNQQVSDMCLLIEIGHNANSLEQAKNAARYVALALSRVLDIE